MKGDAYSLDDWDGLNGWDFFGFISSNGWKLQLGQQVEELKDESSDFENICLSTSNRK